MPRGKKLKESEKLRIIELNAENVSQSEIAKQLGRSRAVIQNFLKLRESYGAKKRSGRPKILKDREIRRIRSLAVNKKMSVRSISAELKGQAKKSTVHNVLKRSKNVKYVKMKTKPPLKKSHIEARLEFAKAHMAWKDQWISVVFSDEKKFNLDGPDGNAFYWHDLRKEKDIFSKRQAGGGSVMIWAAFSYNGTTDAAFVRGGLNAKEYIDLLEVHLLPLGATFGEEPWIFQQDNAPAHTAGKTREWFDRKNIKVLNWPSRSPDLNPIENLWGVLSRRVYANNRQFASVEDLKDAILHEWHRIEPEVLQKLIDSMPNRIFSLIKAKGSSINY